DYMVDDIEQLSDLFFPIRIVVRVSLAFVEKHAVNTFDDLRQPMQRRFRRDPAAWLTDPSVVDHGGCGSSVISGSG
ncbi:MAG: hypothetical protein ACRDNW_28450, partial [Trebonia sp.]